MDKKLEFTGKIITSINEWQQVANFFADNSWVGLDTEFMRDRTYYPQLCLVQLSCDQIDVCLDPLAFDCSSILPALLENKKISKIIHSASQDIEVLGYYCDCEINNLYDTQLAAEFCNLAPQIGYAALVKELLNVDLPKSQTRSNWAKRPLTGKQVEYSLNDVVYLKPLFNILNQKLGGSEKAQWLQQEQDIELKRMQQFRVVPEQAYKNFKPSHRLKPRDQQVIKTILNWREKVAQQTNKPRHWILTDRAIAEIGSQFPNNQASLKKITQQDRRFQNHYLKDIHRCIEKGLNQSAEPVWQKHEQLTDAQKLKVRLLRRELENKAHQYKLPTTRLATRKDLIDYVRDGKGRLAQGWRREILQKLIQKLKQF